jgi:hypothetical protein
VTGRASQPWLVLLVVVVGLGVLGASAGPGSGHGGLAAASTLSVGAHASDLALVPATARNSLIGADAERGDQTPMLLVVLGVVAMVYPARACSDRQPDTHLPVPTGPVRPGGARAPPVIRVI